MWDDWFTCNVLIYTWRDFVIYDMTRSSVIWLNVGCHCGACIANVIYLRVGVSCACACVYTHRRHVFTTQPTNVCASLVTFCAAGGESLLHASFQSVGGKTTSTALYRKQSISSRAKHCGIRWNAVSSKAELVGTTSSGWICKLSWKLGPQKPPRKRERSKGAVRNQERREMAKSDADITKVMPSSAKRSSFMMNMIGPNSQNW